MWPTASLKPTREWLFFCSVNITGDCATQPSHQCPPLHEELCGKQQRHLLITKTQGARLWLRATKHRGACSSGKICHVFPKSTKYDICFNFLNCFWWNLCVCSPCGTCVSSVYQTWEYTSWMTWWGMCSHVWVHRRPHLHWVDRQPGGPRIYLHIPFITISMVRSDSAIDCIDQGYHYNLTITSQVIITHQKRSQHSKTSDFKNMMCIFFTRFKRNLLKYLSLTCLPVEHKGSSESVSWPWSCQVSKR